MKFLLILLLTTMLAIAYLKYQSNKPSPPDTTGMFIDEAGEVFIWDEQRYHAVGHIRFTTGERGE